MLTVTRRLLELVRFSHTLFALPFALLARGTGVAADEAVPLADLVGILLCMVFARSRQWRSTGSPTGSIDARNPRTASRHLPAGTLCVPHCRRVHARLLRPGSSPRRSCSSSATRRTRGRCTSAGRCWCSCCGYSLTKRFTCLAHFWLGAALMLAPVAAWIAMRGLGDMTVPLLLGGAVLFWVAGFDILYACQDADFDRAAGLHSVPARFGVRSEPADRGRRATPSCSGCWWRCTSRRRTWGRCSSPGWSRSGVLLVYEHWLVRPDDLTRVNRAFFQVNGVISVGLAGAGAGAAGGAIESPRTAVRGLSDSRHQLARVGDDASQRRWPPRSAGWPGRPAPPCGPSGRGSCGWSC